MIPPILSIKKMLSSPDDFDKNYNKISDEFADMTLKRAKAMLSQMKSTLDYSSAINMISIAETALKNGNDSTAANFANKAIQILVPGNNSNNDNVRIFKNSSIKEKPIIDLPKKEITHLYKDVSNDAGVSFTYASPLTNAQSLLAVPSHEGEHAGLSISEAVLNGDQVNVIVSYSIRYDPVSGEAYMAGGETRTFKHSRPHNTVSRGALIDVYV
jgi:hypothetical protein